MCFGNLSGYQRELVSKEAALKKAYISESNDWLTSTPSPTAKGRREILLTLAMDCASMSEDSTPGGWGGVSKAMMFL